LSFIVAGSPRTGDADHGRRREAPGISTHADHHFVQPTSVRRVLVGMVGVLLVVAGCGDDDDGVEAAAPDDPGGRRLEGESWLLSADAPLGVALEAGGVTAHFEDGALSGRSGCNEYSTTYEVDGDSLTIGPNVASTQMACPPPQTAVERAYLDRLPRVARYEIDGDTLTMTDDQGDTVLLFQVMDGARAIRGQWTVTTYYAGNAVTSVVGGVTMTAEFEDGTVSGNTGCNTFNGPYEVDAMNITIGPLSSTIAACPTEELELQQTNFLNALELASTFEVAGGRLDLLREGQTYAVTFVTG
jgi:heat shock protein HslJ